MMMMRRNHDDDGENYDDDGEKLWWWGEKIMMMRRRNYDDDEKVTFHTLPHFCPMCRYWLLPKWLIVPWTQSGQAPSHLLFLFANVMLSSNRWIQFLLSVQNSWRGNPVLWLFGCLAPLTITHFTINIIVLTIKRDVHWVLGVYLSSNVFRSLLLINGQLTIKKRWLIWVSHKIYLYFMADTRIRRAYPWLPCQSKLVCLRTGELREINIGSCSRSPSTNI